MIRKASFLAVFIFSALTLVAQEKQIHTPPVPTEFMLGSDRFYFQLSVAKPIQAGSKLGFFNITSYQANYKNTNVGQDLVSISWLHYDVWKGISPLFGVAMNHVTGFKSLAGVQYVFANPKWLVVFAPTIYLTESKEIETFALLENKTPLSQNVKLYTRIQGLFNQNTVENVHERSYLYLRLGVNLRNLSYGIGANFDRYAPIKISKTNYGVFVKAELF